MFINKFSAFLIKLPKGGCIMYYHITHAVTVNVAAENNKQYLSAHAVSMC